MLLFCLLFISLFLLKFIITFFVYKFSKNKKLQFSEIFIYKDELIDSFIITSILAVFQQLILLSDEFVGYAIALVALSIISSYNFLSLPLRAFFQKQKYVKNNLLNDFLIEKEINYNIRIVKGNISNAFAIGILPFTKTILIGEPLYEKMSIDELKAVVYHELGHLKLGHIRKLFFLNLLCTTIFFVINMIRGKAMIEYNLIGTILEPLIVVLIGGLYGLFTFFLIPYIFQRPMEIQADVFATKNIGAMLYVQMLNKLNEINEYEMNKGSITHPPIHKRIDNVWKTEKKYGDTN